MKQLICLALLLAGAMPAWAAPVATFVPGEDKGITVPQAEDGQWEPIELDGRQAIRSKTGMPYLYFKLDPALREKLQGDVYMVIDFYNDGFTPVKTQYDTEADNYLYGPAFILSGNKKWERTLLHLTNTAFNGQENFGTDFRLGPAEHLIIGRVELYDQIPEVKIPTEEERWAEAMRNLPAGSHPTDMSYCFGINECDEAMGHFYKALGVTSLETYVTWETCERAGLDKWDWTEWDKMVDTMEKTDLKWVPFLILGPAYSTPDWFRACDDHFPCRCLEHGIDSKVESLWNPNLPEWIDRFIGEFAKRYRDRDVIESVLLGIQGDFGEAIYSVTGGGWTFNVPGEYHNHAGYWCNDPYARESYHKFLGERYKTIDALNAAWGTDAKAWADLDFPGEGDALDAFQKEVVAGDPHKRREWLDFIDWYRDSMTRFADWWMETTRKYFPDTPIYLCTGGDAEPHHGSNFAEQCRVAAKHGAGVRITNEGSNYTSNFGVTRWVASAGKHYGAYFAFEPAGPENEKGIAARIYNATASGAAQLHDYSPNVVSSPTRIAAQRKNIQYLFHVDAPVVPVALWYPNVSMTLDWGSKEFGGGQFFKGVGQLRDLVDFDFVDESMLATGALKSNRILVILHGKVMETADAQRLAAWMNAGGRIIVMDVPEFESVEGTNAPELALFGDTPQGRTVGQGGIVRVSGWDELSADLGKTLDQLGLAVADLTRDGVFETQIDSNRFLFLNTNDADKTLEIRRGDRKYMVNIPAGSILKSGLGDNQGKQ